MKTDPTEMMRKGAEMDDPVLIAAVERLSLTADGRRMFGLVAIEGGD